MSKNKDFFIHYNQFKDKIYNYFLYRIGFDKVLAEDLTSEVFVKAYKNFDTFDQNRKFQSWIFAIAHNHLVNYYGQSAKVTISLEIVEDYLLEEESHEVEIKYEAEQVLRVIDSMNENDKEVLRLKFVEELNNQEIAEVIGKDEGAIRTQISRSLKRLRQLLNEDNNIDLMK